MCILLLVFLLLLKVSSSPLSWLPWHRLLLIITSIASSTLFANSRSRIALFGSWPVLISYFQHPSEMQEFVPCPSSSLSGTLLSPSKMQGLWSGDLCVLPKDCLLHPDWCSVTNSHFCYLYWPLLLSWPTKAGLSHCLLHVKALYVWATPTHREDQEVALCLPSLRIMYPSVSALQLCKLSYHTSVIQYLVVLPGHAGLQLLLFPRLCTLPGM